MLLLMSLFEESRLDAPPSLPEVLLITDFIDKSDVVSFLEAN